MNEKYLTVTFNPSLDKVVCAENFNINALNRVEFLQYSAGGKGINVSRVIKNEGKSTLAIGLYGGENGKRFKNLLDFEKIPNNLVEISTETRMNIKIIDKTTGFCTEMNERGGEVTDAEIHAVLDKIQTSIIGAGCIFLSGSLPKNAPKTLYADIIKLAKSYEVPAMLDADDEVLALGLETAPYLIKPNLYELSRLFKRDIDNITEAKRFCGSIYNDTGTRIICTMGKNGAIYCGKEGIFEMSAPDINMKNPTGAGDTFLSGFVISYLEGNNPEKALFSANETVKKYFK